MKKLLLQILSTVLFTASISAADVELTRVSDLTSQYFIMAYSDNGTYMSPYWMRSNNQNVMSPGESAVICNGKDYYYLMKAQAVTYKGEQVYRISISNGLHELFPNGIGGSAYLNSAGWCFFAGESEASGKSHVYGQDDDALGLWRITYSAGNGFQFQCVGNSKYISYTMGHSSTANKYYWRCFAEGSLYSSIEALKVSAPFVAHTEMRKMLQAVIADKTNITCDNAERTTLSRALTTAQKKVSEATTEAEIMTAVAELQAAGCMFLNAVTLAKGYQLNITPLLINASFPCNTGDGWYGAEAGFQTYTNAEFFQQSYDFHQTMPDMPQGVYMLRMQGFQRTKESNDKDMTAFLKGTLTQSNAYLYANEEETALATVARDAQTTGSIGGTQYTVSGKSYWMPNSMSDARKYFANGQYWNYLTINHTTRGDITIGIRSSQSSQGTWTCFDNFELYYQGEGGDVTDATYLIVNPSFETGTSDGWRVGQPSEGGDIGVKKNEGVYLTEGADGDYLFNTWSAADDYAYSSPVQYVEQTLRQMKPGEYHLQALAASNTYQSVKTPVELYGNNYVTSFVPPSKTVFKQNYEVVIYLTSSEPDLIIGMRSASWFKTDNFRLTYLGKTEQYEQIRRMATVNLYEEIATQALDRSSYDAVLNEVREALLAEEISDEEIARQNERLREALIELVRTGNTATGQFDITVLLNDRNPQQADNISSLTTLKQTLTNMPAGHYTFRAHALYRPSAITNALEMYEAGTEDHPASIYIDKHQAPILNIFDDARHATTSATDVYATIDGRGAPMSESATNDAFRLGDYGAVVESDLEADGTMTLGFRIKAPKKTDNRFVANNMQLLYGETPTVTLSKTIPARQLTPLCVPFELTSDSVCQLYMVGSILNGQATIFPVTTVHACEPCVILTTDAIDAFRIPATKVWNKQADITPLPWDGGTVSGDLTHYTWTTTSIDGKTVTPAENLTYIVADPLDMEFTVNLENLQARRFLKLENYVTTTSSRIANYNHTPPARRDYPNSVGIPLAPNNATRYRIILSSAEDMSNAKTSTGRLTDGKLLYLPNLLPQHTYYYEILAGDVTVGKGKFHTDGHLRMIYAPSIDNIRDMGGWQTIDGRYIRYGLIYRGGEFNGSHTATTAAIKRVRDLGVTAEIDLRIDYEQEAGKSVFGFSAAAGTFYFANAMDCYVENLSSQDSYNRWKSAFNLIIKTLRKGGSIYFHCRIGADRTGMLSLLLEGLLGVPRDQSNKNYELTTLSPSGLRTRDTQDAFFDYFNTLKGTTLQQKFNTFFVEKLGISQADIDEFRAIMLTTDLTDPIEDQPLSPLPRGGELYNLQGQRISVNSDSSVNSVLPKGVYIKDGKKYLIK